MSTDNPCLNCGACCAFFRVSFYWGECRSAGGLVPDELTVGVTPHHVAMVGTDTKPARCVSLLGDVGCGTRCTMYESRPSPCREFEASWINGEHNERCDAARAAYGLPPLTPPLQPHQSPERVAW
ncbi:YkgJ family cysteine cluster protein [Pseudomonas luteola]|nr:YkgJ family cysteine cluster protein [Pseudomonas luteola]